MRADQIERLKDLAEKLAEVVLEEADPDLWPGAGVTAADMSQEERGNRYWCKKNAAATFALLERSHSLLTDAQETHSGGKPHVRPELDAQINAHEKQAAKMIEAIQARARTAGRGA